MKAKNIYVYKESGLDNVLLHNLSFTKDVVGEDIVYIPKINQLHKLIAQAIISKKGKITLKELRFLRTEMSLKQSELSELLGREAQAAGRWERGENPIDYTVDILIRTLVRDYYKFDANLNIGAFSAWTKEPDTNTINIEVNGEDYKLLPAA